MNALSLSPVIKNFLTYSSGAIILRGITAMTALVTIGILTTSEFGLLSLLNNFCALFPLFLNLGLRQVFGLEYFHHDSEGRQKTFHHIIQTYLIISLPIFVLLMLNYQQVNHIFFLNQASSFTIQIALIYCFFQFFSELYLQVLRYQSNAFQLTITQVLAALITILSTTILVFYYNLKIVGILTSNLFGILSISLIALFFYNQKIGFHKKHISIPPFKSASRLLWLGLPFIPNILFTWILSFGDRWVLAQLTSMHIVGIYAFADLASQLFQMTILLPLSGSYIPYLLKQYADKKEPLEIIEQRNITTMWYAMAIVGIGVTVGSVMAVMFGPWILPSKYHQSLYYIWPILMGNTIFMGTYFSSCYLIFSKRIWTQLFLTMSAAILNIILNIALVPFFSINGCIIATLIANSAFFLMNLHLAYAKKTIIHLKPTSNFD